MPQYLEILDFFVVTWPDSNEWRISCPVAEDAMRHAGFYACPCYGELSGEEIDLVASCTHSALCDVAEASSGFYCLSEADTTNLDTWSNCNTGILSGLHEGGIFFISQSAVSGMSGAFTDRVHGPFFSVTPMPALSLRQAMHPSGD